MHAGKPSPFKVQASPLLLITVALLAVAFAVRSLFVVLLVCLPAATCPLIILLDSFYLQQISCMASTIVDLPTRFCSRQPQKSSEVSVNGNCMTVLSDCNRKWHHS